MVQPLTVAQMRKCLEDRRLQLHPKLWATPCGKYAKVAIRDMIEKHVLPNPRSVFIKKVGDETTYAAPATEAIVTILYDHATTVFEHLVDEDILDYMTTLLPYWERCKGNDVQTPCLP